MPFGEDIFTGIGGRTTEQKYSSSGDDIRQKFTGYQKDTETSLDFAEARMYENRHGRFTAVDPLLASGNSSNPQTFNRYVYVGNNPLLFVDPTGLIWGENEEGKVRWFNKKLGKGYKEFTPDNWQYEGKDHKNYELDPNSSKWWEIKPVQVYEDVNPIQTFAISVSDTFDDSISGAGKGGANFGINILNFATQPGSLSGEGLGIPNPFEVAPYTYNNATEEKFGTATTTGLTLAPLFAAGQFSPSGGLSVVPGEFTIPVSSTTSVSVVADAPAAVHGNSLSSLRPTWGYRLFGEDGTFLKNGITSQPVAEARYTKGFMFGKKMETSPFPNRLAARIWERHQNTINPGPLNIRR